MRLSPVFLMPRVMARLLLPLKGSLPSPTGGVDQRNRRAGTRGNTDATY
jgi:hypothetical protein